jgi:Rne/Rng family ribonuclease
MSKELVISAASHERRVAILEEGQLVEIYIEREKEFALVGSIYKGRVTRVLPGMQSAFVDIGLDGDAFLYVSDVFENLEDYDPGHGHGEPHAVASPVVPAAGPSHVELLPGEILSHAQAGDESSHAPNGESTHLDIAEATHEEHEHAQAHEHGDEGSHEVHDEAPEEIHAEAGSPSAPRNEPGNEDVSPEDERQPESNASAPQNFGHQYNPTQRYPQRNDRGPADFRGGDRGNDRGADRGSDRGGDRGGRGRWGRRGGRRRGGRPQGAPGGRNLPPSKYAAPQGGDPQRSNDSRGNDRGNDRGYDNRDQRGGGRFERGGEQRRGESRGADRGPRPSGPPQQSGSTEEPFVLPGESLAKYRGKPLAASSAPAAEPEIHERQPEVNESAPRGFKVPPASAPQSTNVPRRSSGGLPRWLLAETEAAAEAESADGGNQEVSSAEDTDTALHDSGVAALHETREPFAADQAAVEPSLSEEEVDALSTSLVEAKHDEIQATAPADALAGGADFDDDEEDDEENEEEVDAIEVDEIEVSDESTEEVHASEEAEAADENHEELDHAEGEAQEAVELSPRERAEAEADAAHDDALHAAGLADHAESAHTETDHADSGDTHADAEGSHEGDHEHGAHESLAASGESASRPGAEDDSILLPGETRAPRSAGAPREEFAPRDSARIGGNPRSRFQRPYRSGGRDRGGRDSRGGDRGADRGGRTDRGGSDRGGSGGSDRGRDRGGRPGGRPGGRFERRPGGGPRHDRGGYQRSGPPRRPQLISEMLKAGQDVVIQIAKEPLGKKGARITSHVALPGRFLVYMPTVHHTGVSRKIISAENRSRLRRLVSEAGNAYSGGFIVRTAAGDATDDEIRADIDFLGKTWLDIKQKSEERKAPALLHRDLDLVERMLRDYVSDDFSAIWIDNEEEYGKVVEFVSRFQPKLVSRVKLYTKETPIFEEFGIQHELDKALRAKVWLKSGGYIVINHTEALVAIDVNTGKFVGKGSTRLEDTIVKTNLEAVKEIVRQIRLRDLGGIIVVDFIDMEERRNREKVLSALQQALEQDKAPSKALSFNEFGLVCITRKRTKQALERVLCQPCPYCTGSGMVKSSPTLCYEIQAEARKMATADHENPNLTLRVHPEIAKALKTRESMLIDELEQTTHKHVIIQSDATLHWEQYDIY